MEEVLPGIWSLSPLAALVGFIVFLGMAIARGWLIPRISFERELDQRDKAHATNLAQANQRGDEWKETALAGREVVAEQAKQITLMARGQQTSAEFFGTVKAGEST